MSYPDSVSQIADSKHVTWSLLHPVNRYGYIRVTNNSHATFINKQLHFYSYIRW